MGFYFGATKEGLSSEEIADNIEYILYEDKYPWTGIKDSLTIGQFKTLYLQYRGDNSPLQSRQLLELYAQRICTKRYAPADFSVPKWNALTDFDVDINDFGVNGQIVEEFNLTI